MKSNPGGLNHSRKELSPGFSNNPHSLEGINPTYHPFAQEPRRSLGDELSSGSKLEGAELKSFLRNYRSEFGNVLHNNFLEPNGGNKITQKTLAQISGVSESVISRMASRYSHFEKGKSLYDDMYAIFKALAKPEMVGDISVEKAEGLIKTIPDDNLSIALKNKLVSTLTNEKIIKPIYETKQYLRFIGRDDDIKNILEKLLKEHFVAITGTIGIGKSELARQVETEAKRPGHFPFVIKIVFKDYINTEDALAEIHRVLRDLPPNSLVRLENCEYLKHLKHFTDELYNLLSEHTQLYILATSRVSMNHNADYPIQPLKIEDAEQLFRDAAERIGKTLTNNDATKVKVKELCELLDRLPLALRLDAGLLRNETLDNVYDWTKETFTEMYNWTKENSIEHNILDAEIPSENVRHQTTLQILFDKHYNDLGKDKEDEQERQQLQKQLQALFRRLAIFVAPCKIKAVQAVCIIKNDLPEQELGNLLRRLEDHYLITYENGWIEIIHNILRIFANRKINDKDNEEEASEVQRKFIDYYKSLVIEYMEQQFNKDELEITAYLESSNNSFDNISYAYKLNCISNAFSSIEKRVKVRLGEEYKNIQEPLIKYFSKYKTTDFSKASDYIKEQYEKWCKEVEEVCEQEKDLNNDYLSLDLWQNFFIKVKRDMVNLTGLYKAYGIIHIQYINKYFTLRPS